MASVWFIKRFILFQSNKRTDNPILNYGGDEKKSQNVWNSKYEFQYFHIITFEKQIASLKTHRGKEKTLALHRIWL